MTFKPYSAQRIDLGQADVVLVGAGIMSATLASMLRELAPDWDVVVLERDRDVATESSDPWNNAGTGHSGFCELNYMPDPTDAAKPIEMASQFLQTRQWWSHLATHGDVDPSRFVHATPHMTVVFGERDCAYLRTRAATLRNSPLFRTLEFSEDPAEIATWAPLVIEGRDPAVPVAATRHMSGTDVDFGALTRQLLVSSGARVLTEHTVTRIRRSDGRGAVVRDATSAGRFEIRARHVFVGSGGQALRTLQRAKVDEVRKYGVLPVGAAFLRTASPDVTSAHDAKVYGQAAIGAPPMSVPHLDRRVVDGSPAVMFGPYATFSTKLLTKGRITDFFATLRPTNVWTVVSAGATNVPLVRYLVGELLASRRRQFEQLQHYLPTARIEEWETVPAGQRAQLVVPGPRSIGVLRAGTELVVSDDHCVSGLLGASPGASTAVPIMLDLLQRAFPAEWSRTWRQQFLTTVPAASDEWTWTDESVASATEATADALGLVNLSASGSRTGE